MYARKKEKQLTNQKNIIHYEKIKLNQKAMVR